MYLISKYRCLTEYSYSLVYQKRCCDTQGQLHTIMVFGKKRACFTRHSSEWQLKALILPAAFEILTDTEMTVDNRLLYTVGYILFHRTPSNPGFRANSTGTYLNQVTGHIVY